MEEFLLNNPQPGSNAYRSPDLFTNLWELWRKRDWTENDYATEGMSFDGDPKDLWRHLQIASPNPDVNTFRSAAKRHAESLKGIERDLFEQAFARHFAPMMQRPVRRNEWGYNRELDKAIGQWLDVQKQQGWKPQR